jgi:hypothetical protein
LTTTGADASPWRVRSDGREACAAELACFDEFDGSHELGTRQDALAVARAIRASTAQRLARVAAVPVPPQLGTISSRWISLQRRLAATYAERWVRIYDTIDAARTPARRAELAARLYTLVHAPDPMRHAASQLEHQLGVRDCTGGG